MRLPAARGRKEIEDNRCYLSGEPRRNRVAYLRVLFRAVTLKKVVIRERLKAGGFTHRQATTLGRVGMDEVMTIFGDMGYNSGRWLSGNLDPEAILEWNILIGHVVVIG